MKKTLTLIIAAAMLTACSVTAFAAPITQDTTPPSGGTTVNYSADAAYTVVIPESVTLSDTADVTETIKIYGKDENSNVVLSSKQKVNVALTNSTNNFNVKTNDGSELPYTVNGKNAVADLTTVAECAANEKTDTDITFSKIENVVYSGTYADTLTFTVSLTGAKTNVTSVAIDDKSTTKLTKGNTLTLSATVDDVATDKTVVWSSSDDSVASVENGVVTANKSGTATITVTATNGTEDTSDDKTDTITIPVTNPATGITLNKSTLTLTTGDTDSTLSANVTPDDADDKSVTWTSSDTSIATVDGTGKVTGVKAGTATITATNVSGQTSACTVTVSEPTPSVTLADAYVSGNTTTVKFHNYWNESTITFTNNNGSYSIDSSNLIPSLVDTAKVEQNGDNLVITVSASGYGFSSSITFNRVDNTYTVWDSGYFETDSVTSVIVKGVDITNTVTKK